MTMTRFATPPEPPVLLKRDPDQALHDRVQALNARFAKSAAQVVLGAVLRDGCAGRVAMVSSFGAEAVALLHMIALIDRKTPILFIDTELLFTETLVYQQELVERLRLENLRILRASPADIAARDPYGGLRLGDPDSCCALRKTAPLQAALKGFDGWITGRKRFQTQARRGLGFFEVDPEGDRIKINPMAFWRPEDVQTYIEENRLPRHPLVARGYRSIGCAPCTRPTDAAEDARAGRWAGQAKEECGLHLTPSKQSLR